jgi:hypothetical protein
MHVYTHASRLARRHACTGTHTTDTHTPARPHTLKQEHKPPLLVGANFSGVLTPDQQTAPVSRGLSL